MTELTLPEPAADLWIETRDILTHLGPGEHPWTVHLGGGTILAAHMHHRKSTDIDVVVRNVQSLGALAQPGPENLATRVGGKPLKESEGQIKVQMENGVIDLNIAPVIPRVGHEDVTIMGRKQSVLSPTQILRGKLERANKPAPVRDVYDVIRVADDPRLAGSLAAAYGLLIGEEQDTIETGWLLLDEAYEEEAAEELKLTEEPRADLAMLGSTAALVLNNHRLSRLVIALEGSRLEIERTTRNGRTFTTNTEARNAGATMNQLGVNIHISDHNGSHGDVVERIQEHVNSGRTGVIFDTGNDHPEHRLDGRNASMKRAEAKAAMLSLQGSKATGVTTPLVVRGEGRPVGGGTVTTGHSQQDREQQGRGGDGSRH